MERDYDFVTFDCYGTLIDWRNGIHAAFAEAASRDGIEIDRRRVLAAHAEIEPQVQAGPFRSYRAVLADTALRIAERLDWKLAPADATFLADSLPGWPVFPDTNEALRRLSEAGYRLGILSNVDDDLLCETLRRVDGGFELIVTAERVRSYKPADPHFHAAAGYIGAARWVHAAQSWFHDIVPAARRGLPSIWINRGREQPGSDGAPVAEFVDLAGLADFLAGPPAP